MGAAGFLIFFFFSAYLNITSDFSWKDNWIVYKMVQTLIWFDQTKISFTHDEYRDANFEQQVGVMISVTPSRRRLT